jgi:hypothetical protein
VNKVCLKKNASAMQALEYDCRKASSTMIEVICTLQLSKCNASRGINLKVGDRVSAFKDSNTVDHLVRMTSHKRL